MQPKSLMREQCNGLVLGAQTRVTMTCGVVTW